MTWVTDGTAFEKHRQGAKQQRKQVGDKDRAHNVGEEADYERIRGRGVRMGCRMPV